MDSGANKKRRRPGGNLANDDEDDDDLLHLPDFLDRGRGQDAAGRQSSQQSSSSQQPITDEELRFAELLRPIKDLTQNWEVPLSLLLENYMQELQLDGDLADAAAEAVATKVNFTEAALILQGTSSVYSKKSVLQMLDLLASRRALLEEDANEDHADRDKPGRKGRKGLGFDADDFQSVKIDMCKHIYMKLDTTSEKTFRERRSMLGFITVTPRQLIEKEAKETKGLTVSLYGRGGGKDLLGHKEDFRINAQFALSTGMLGDAQFTAAEELFTQTVSLLGDEEQPFRETTLLRPTNPIVHNEIEFTSQLNEEPASPMADIPDDHNYTQPFDDPPLDDPGGPDEDLVLQPQATAPPMDKFDALLANSHIVEHDYASSFGSSDDAEDGRRSRRNLHKERLEEPRAPLEDPWEPIKPHEIMGPPPKPVRKGRTCRAPKLISEEAKKKDINARSNRYKRRGTNDESAEEDSSSEESIRQRVSVVVPIEEYLIHEVVHHKYHNLATMHGVVPELQDCAYEESKRRKQELAEDKKETEDAVADNGAKEVDQQDVPEPVDPPNQDLHDDWDDFGGEPAVDDLFENVDAGSLADVVPSAVVSADEAPPDTYEDLVVRRVAEYVQQSQVYLHSTDLAKRVSRWHDHLHPILDQAEKRGHFDIHKYGSDLLSYFPAGAAKTTIKFNDCVQGKDREEVCRYFLSSLMLANTYNVELSTSNSSDATNVPSEPNPVQKKTTGKRASASASATTTSASSSVLAQLPMDCMELTLLSRRRHHEEMLMPDEELEQSQTQTPPGEIRRKEPKGKRKAKPRPDDPVHSGVE